MDINEMIARQLNALRSERGLTIEALANRSGVSRAMISRIERAQSSPTATVLSNLSIGLGVGLEDMFGPIRSRSPRLRLRSPVVSRSAQPEWVDRVTGYRRRTLTPAVASTPSCRRLQLHEVHCPPDARVIFEGASGGGAHQQLWLLRGQLEVRAEGEFTVLRPGDCMALTPERAVAIHNTGNREARYLTATVEAS